MQIDTSKISKTTINGLLSCAIAVTMAVIALPPKASVPVCILAVLRAISGFMQGDAPSLKDVSDHAADLKTQQIEEMKKRGSGAL